MTVPRALPCPGQVSIHFCSLSSSDSNIRGGGPKMRGRGQQFPVFVIIIGYIYRKKVN